MPANGRWDLIRRLKVNRPRIVILFVYSVATFTKCDLLFFTLSRYIPVAKIKGKVHLRTGHEGPKGE